MSITLGSARAGWFLVGLALLLYALRSITGLPSGYTIEHFLGFTDAAAVAAAIDLWSNQGTWWYAAAFLVLDLLLFIPLYALVALRCVRWLERRKTRRWITWAAVAVVAALVLADIVETSFGLAKLTQFYVALPLTAIALTELVRVTWFRELRLKDRAPAVVGLAVGFLLLWLPPESLQCASDSWVVGCMAHSLKPPLTIAALAVPALGGALWLAGWEAKPLGQQRRARLRAAMGDVFARCRYVVIGLVIIAALVLGMDQSRDVFVGMVTDAADASFGVTLVSLAVSLVALWTLSHSTWLWARVLCRVPGPRSVARRPDKYIEGFVKYWGRALGVAPLVIYALLASAALHDLASSGAHRGAGVLLVAAIVAIVTGGIFIYSRELSSRTKDLGERYYDDPSALTNGCLRLRTWTEPRWGFWILFSNAPVNLPIVAFAAMMAARVPSTLGLDWPPMVFSIMLFGFSAWIGIFGWLAILERRHAVPWILALFFVVGSFGVLGWTENHTVWLLEHQVPGNATWPMWAMSTLIAAILCATGWFLAARWVDTTVFRRVGAVAACIAAVVGSLWFFDGRTPSVERTAPASGVTLDAAFERWARELRAAETDQRSVPVYFVAAEGGGSRAAYWTARVLLQLEKGDERFPRRAFAISGVSGGSVGAAIFVACHRDPRPLEECIDAFGSGDLISPLIGSWMFEDALAKVLPSSRLCDTPACGLLSRGVWFERALESSVPSLSKGLRTTAAGSGARLPFLLLNSTWVEGGERTIASEIEISCIDFPTARDTVGILRHDISLATAAHNSARFPFVNAIGYLSGTMDTCGPRTREPQDVEGHVADGGYFDNSGAQTTIDVLRGFRRWLETDVADGDLKEWARATLDPQIVLIHNGTGIRCPKPMANPKATDVACPIRPDEWEPESLRDGPVSLYASALGPLVTAVNVTGLGSNRRRSEAVLRAELTDLRRWLKRDPEGIERFAQLDGKALYPLGWYLSALARLGLDCQSYGVRLRATLPEHVPAAPTECKPFL